MLMAANPKPLSASGLKIEVELTASGTLIAPVGPRFELVEETTWQALQASGRQWPFDRPLLVKGGVRHWPAFQKWTFDLLAEVCEASASQAPVKFTDGLVEQGVTKGRPFLPVAPYLRELGEAAMTAVNPAAGLLPRA